MSKRGPNAHQAQDKGQFNSFSRSGECNSPNNQHNGQQQKKKQQQQDSQGKFSSGFLTSPLTLSERVNAHLSASYSGKKFKNQTDHGGGENSQDIHQSLHQHQNAQYSHTELISNGMENNPTRSSTPNRGRSGARGGRGASGGGRGRGNGENRGGRGGGYQGRNDDGRTRNDSWNSPAATPPAGNEADEEFEDNVRDLTAMPASRMAKFSNNSLEQASYEELKIARDRERRDAIANGTIDDPEQRKTLEHAIDFVGTCMDMCPLFERQQRAVQNAVDRWEINPSTGKIDKALAVKQFHRPAAGNDAQLPSDVRPPSILISTLDYLINDIAGGAEPLELTHPFLRDRTRGIRQDFTLQNYRGSETVACHELIARFHILSIHKLCEETKNFVPQQEMEQLQKVLTTLSELYEDARLVNIIYPNEPEFRAYQIIAHLRDPDQERQAQRWPDHVFNSKPVQQALRFLTLTQRNNDEAVHMRVGNAESCSNFFGTVFRLVKAKSTSYLMACLLETHFNEVRKTALKAIKNTYRPDTKQLLLKDVVEMLAYENEEMAFRDCEYYGIGLGQVEVEGQMVWHLVIRKGGANWNEGLSALRQSFHTNLVESKIGNRSIPDVIYGRRASSNKGLNPAVAAFLPGTTAFGDLPATTLGIGSFPSGLTQQGAFNKAPMVASHNSAITSVFGVQKSTTTPAFGPTAQQSFQVGFQSTTSKPIAGIFANAASQQASNVFQKTSNVPLQAANVFQKAGNNMPMASVFKSQIAAGPVTQTSVFQTGTPTWGAPQKSQDSCLAQISTQPPVSVFAPGVKKSPAFPTVLPSSVFSPIAGMPAIEKNVFKKAQAPVGGLPSGIFSTHGATSANFMQSSVFQQDPANGISQPSNLTPESFFQQVPSEVASSGGSQSPAVPHAVPQSDFRPRQAPPASLFQPQVSSTASQSIFQQGHPKVTLNGLFQPSITTPTSPPSVTPVASLFQPQATIQQSPETTVTTSLSSGSIFDSYPGQKSFPSDFFSVPTGPTDDDDEEEEDAHSAPVPVQKVSSGSLFDRIGNPPAQGAAAQTTTGTSEALSSFAPPTSFTQSSSLTPFSSFTAPNLPLQPISLQSSTQPIKQQLVPAVKPLVSRSAAWELANSLFDKIIAKEVTKTIQSAVDEDKAKVIDAVAIEKYKDAEKLVARKLALDIAAEQFYANRSGASIFYAWKAKARKLMMKRIGEERRRNPPAPPPIQWRPVQIPEGAFDGPITEVQRMTTLTYRSVPLKEIFLPKVEQAFWSTGEGDRRWRLLCKSANSTVDVGNYWWIEKLVGNGEPRIAMSKKGVFEVQFDLSDAHAEAREVGGFVFGCSADYSISNKERFRKDKANLHEAVNWLTGVTELPKLAVMVVCYRSPLDVEDADPYGRDMGRTSGPGRRARIAAIRKALDLDAFDEKVIGRDIILVENLGDCNFTPAMKQFSDLVLETVNPKVAEMMLRAPSPETMAKQNLAKRKRAAKQQQLSVGSPKPTKPAPKEAMTPEGRPKRQRVIRNVGMQTNYFTIKSRGLHVDWDKFQMPGGGTLGDGVENPVVEEYLVTTTPIITPERRPVLSKNDSPLLDGLKDDLQDLERIMMEVNGMFDEGIEQLEGMKREIREIDGDSNLAMESGW